MAFVVAKASERKLKTTICDRRTLYIESRTCQVIKTRWFEDYPGCRYMTMYLPQNDFADFLLYVTTEQDAVYIVPRSKIAHDTRWSGAALEPFKDAWHWLKETTPVLFERRTEALSKQLRRVIEEAEKRSLPYELITTKPGRNYRTYAQRRILIKGRRCAIFRVSLFSPKPHHAREAALFRTTTDDWPEIFLYILDEDIYVVPRAQVPHERSLSLNNSRMNDFKNAWCVLDGVDPTSWKEMKEHKRRLGE